MTYPMRIGQVALTVHDLDGVASFYQSILGLMPLERDGEVARFGAGGTALLELRRDRAARRHDRHEAGLFHTAFLLPDRAALGSWLRHAAALGLRLDGASDHWVSEAVYLADPEGNGIEIYADRPASAWTVRDGLIEMPSEPLDLRDLMAASGATPWKHAPEGSTIGHVHLQVGAVEEAEPFYSGVLGFDVTWRYRGGRFYGSGGYHHQLATNAWNSQGAGPRDLPATGLAEVGILAEPGALAAAAGRAGVRPDSDGALVLTDPWGTRLRLAPG